MSFSCFETGRTIKHGEDFKVGTRDDGERMYVLSHEILDRVPESKRRSTPCKYAHGGTDIYEATNIREGGLDVRKGLFIDNISDKFDLGKFLFSISQKTAEKYLPHSIKTIIPMCIPDNLDQATCYLYDIGKFAQEIEDLKSSFKDQIRKLKAETARGVTDREKRISRLSEGLYIFAKAHRQVLTEGGKKKTVSLPNGEFGWRLMPPKKTEQFFTKPFGMEKEIPRPGKFLKESNRVKKVP